MHKYEEERYLFKNIKNKIYPWIKERLVDYQALNGKYISPKDTPNVSVEDIYGIACENLVRDVKFVISNTMYGGFRIIADGLEAYERNQDKISKSLFVFTKDSRELIAKK